MVHGSERRRRRAGACAGCAAAVALGLLLSAPAARAEQVGARRAAPEALSLEVQRYVLANGLTVLLAPDPTVGSAAVWMSFRAGALYEPPGRAGLAHLVEHVMTTGATPETDYAALLEARRARFFNAETTSDRMTFEAVVPAEELPAALWVAGDRLVALPATVDDAVVERNRRAVLEERALRDVDAPYGLFREHVVSRVFPAPHPLHRGVIGAPAELAQVTTEDVRRFAATYLVPANGVLTVVGRFDPAAVRAEIARDLGGLPAGQAAQPPPRPRLARALVDKRQEPLGRRPRVVMAWRFDGVPLEDQAALEVGAMMLTCLTDGAWGMELSAGVWRVEDEDVFLLDFSVPYDEPMDVVHRDAEGLLRQLTKKEMPWELVAAANLALDRVALARLDAVGGRAALLDALEREHGGRYRVAEVLGWHWELERGAMRDVARQYLRGPSVVVHARPVRPRPARAERE